MAIRKISQTPPTMASIVNAYSTSTQDGYACDYINDMSDYSTSEVNTHRKWVDGKEIYRKVLNVANLNASTLKLAHGITNVGVPINIYGYLTRSDGGSKTFPFPKIDPNSSAWSIGFESFDATDISFSIGASLVSKINGGYLVIEYTKTTD